MDKEKIINILNTIADLMEIKGENVFKCNAYRNAARSIEIYEGDFQKLIENREISELKGIGKSLAEKIETFAKTGTLNVYDELKKEFPEGILEMLKIVGMGPKKVKAVYEKLGIKNVGELEYACIENRLVELQGFGLKTQSKILKGIELYRKSVGKFLIDTAIFSAERIVNELKKLPEVKSIEVAGSLRRAKETVKDIDILAASDNPAPIMDKFVSLNGIAQVNAKGETKSSVVLDEAISVDLRIVSEESFPSALNYFTGSKEHNVALRSRAIKMGMKLSEYGIFKVEGEKEIPLKCKSEADIYKILNLAYIPPELREDRGEVEAAEKNTLPNLVCMEDIQGIFHIHSDYSDGAITIKSIVEHAKSLGLKYVGISDHSQSAFYAKGLKVDSIKKQWDEIDELNSNLKDFKIFKGIESDILRDGSLDYEDEILRGFDFIIGSVHSHFNLSEDEMTKRVIKAIENPYITMLGHPTGRLLLARDGYQINIDAVIEAAAKHKVIIEINSNPYRLDLDWRHCKKAIENGVMLSINPDAHARDGFSHIRFGVGVARKGWCEKKDILNTRTSEEVMNIFKKKKS